MRINLLIFILLFGTPLRAEEACPKFSNGCVPLEHFECSYVAHDECVQRICYNQHARYMIIWLGTTERNTPYHYCDIGPDEVNALKAAVPMCPYYKDHMRSKLTGEHGPYDCRDHPVPTTFD
jgi:hypothetical protein